METYIDKSYYDGTHNGSSDILRQVFPYLDSTTNRCFNIRYIANPKRETSILHIDLEVQRLVSNHVEPKLMGQTHYWGNVSRL